MLLFIAVHADLVAPDDGIEPVLLAEPSGDVWPELHTDTALARSSAGGRMGISPEHLHHQPRLAGLSLLVPVQLPDVIESDVIV